MKIWKIKIKRYMIHHFGVITIIFTTYNTNTTAVTIMTMHVGKVYWKRLKAKS